MVISRKGYQKILLKLIYVVVTVSSALKHPNGSASPSPWNRGAWRNSPASQAATRLVQRTMPHVASEVPGGEVAPPTGTSCQTGSLGLGLRGGPGMCLKETFRWHRRHKREGQGTDTWRALANPGLLSSYAGVSALPKNSQENRTLLLVFEK